MSLLPALEHGPGFRRTRPGTTQGGSCSAPGCSPPGAAQRSGWALARTGEYAIETKTKEAEMTETMQARGATRKGEAITLVLGAVRATGPIGDQSMASYLAQVKDLALGLSGVATEVEREASAVVRTFSGTGTLARVVERYRTSSGKITDLGRVVIEPDHGRHETEEIWIDLRSPSGTGLVERAKDLVGMAVRYSRESRTEMGSGGARINPETQKPQTRPYLVAIEAVGDTTMRPRPITRDLVSRQPTTSGELLAWSAAHFGIERDEVARIVVSTCGELRAERRSPGELALAWRAICSTCGVAAEVA